MVCNALSRVPSFPDPTSPWWPPVLFMRAGSLLGYSWLYLWTPTFKMPNFLKVLGSGDPRAEQTEGRIIKCPTLSTIPPLKG